MKEDIVSIFHYDNLSEYANFLNINSMLDTQNWILMID